MTQAKLGLVYASDRVMFAEVVPRNGTAPVLHVANHPDLGRVTFNLDSRRFAKQGFRLILIGSSGAGKSYTMGVLAEEVHRAGIPFLVFDQEGEFGGLGTLPGVHVIEVRQESDLTHKETSEFVLQEGGAVVVDVAELGLESQRFMFYRLAQQFYHVAGEAKRRCFVLVDEAAEMAPQRKLRGADESREWLERFARRGRKRGINWVMATQRPGDLSKGVFAHANVKLIGNVQIINDYDAVRPYLSRRVPLVELARLETGHFLLDVAGQSEIVQIRPRRTEDWGWTPVE